MKHWYPSLPTINSSIYIMTELQALGFYIHGFWHQTYYLSIITFFTHEANSLLNSYGMHARRKNMCWSTALCHESKLKKPIYGTFHIFRYYWIFYSRRIRTNVTQTLVIFHWLALGLNWYQKMDFSSLFQREKYYRNVECNDA